MFLISLIFVVTPHRRTYQSINPSIHQSINPSALSIPLVSILVAARNEENNILECLKAIDQLSYPVHRLEILVGNDQSDDSTAELVQEFIHGKPHFRLYNITQPLSHQRGKANVLAQLASGAKGDYLFFTDADTRVPSGWIEAMLAECPPSTGIVTGVTLVAGSRLFDRMQALDWLNALGLIKIASDWQIPLTAMGNNMLVSRPAYLATGGYESLPFSLAEDWQLFQAIVANGFGFRNLLQTNVVAFTKPTTTLTDWLHQRKRWMQGAMQLPWYIIGALWSQALLAPAIVALAFFFPTLALVIFAVKVIIHTTFTAKLLYRLKQPTLLRYLPVYQLYAPLASLALIVFYLLPVKVAWKGRKFSDQ